MDFARHIHSIRQSDFFALYGEEPERGVVGNDEWRDG